MGMNLNQDFFQVSKLSEYQKKVFTRNGTLFLSTDLRLHAHQSQIMGGNADEDHTQIVGGYTVKILEWIYPHTPPPPPPPPPPTLVSAPLILVN